MADKGLYPQNLFDDLRPYADWLVTGTTTIGDLAYTSTADLYSTCALVLPAAGQVGPNVNLDLFRIARNDVGQGFAGAVGLGQTNSFFPAGQAPANMCYIATHCGWQIWQTNAAGAPNPAAGWLNQGIATANACYAASNNLSWDVTIGNGPTRNLGLIKDWGAVSGGYGSGGTGANVAAEELAQLGSPGTPPKRMPVPLVFPPMIDVRISLNSGSATTFAGIGANALLVRLNFSGYMMQMPAG